MNKIVLAAGLLPAILLQACDRAPSAPTAPAGADAGPVPTVTVTAPGSTSGSPDDAAGPAPVPTVTPAPTSTPTPTPTTSGGDGNGGAAGPGVNDGRPDLTPVPLTPQAEKGIKGARNVLLSFARAIELKEWDQAWRMLSRGDRQKWPRREFARQFSDLGKTTVAIPGGEVEGAAGSLYYTGPITITASDRDGRPVRYEGEAVLRRVNDVDGATPAQLRWHFDQLKLNWTH